MKIDKPTIEEVKSWDNLLRSRHASSVALGIAACIYGGYVYYGGAAEWTALAFAVATLFILIPLLNSIK